MKIRYVEELPEASKWLELRKQAGLNAHERPLEVAQKGLDNSIYGVSVYDGTELIGMARIVGDGYTCFYLQDVIVSPNYQGYGIGNQIMLKMLEYLDNVDDNAIIGLMSAKGKEGFYERFGFVQRPTNELGSGMIKIRL